VPFTLFHFGPGLLLKSAAPRQLSILSYAAANVVIDLESLYHLLHHDWPVHRWAHTFVAASLIGTAVGLVLSIALRRAAAQDTPRAPAFSGELNQIALIVGGFLGGVTHPLLDGLMHPDIRPFQPFTDANPLLGAVSLPLLLRLCVGTGLLGVTILLFRRSSRKAAA